MSDVELDTLSFTVPKGRTFSVATPTAGVFVAHEGETVMLVRARSYDACARKFIEAFEALNRPERDESAASAGALPDRGDK